MFTRREILSALGSLPLTRCLTAAQSQSLALTASKALPKRPLGRTGMLVTPLALGGQASLQWTKAGMDPAAIIVRAVQLGVNYLDSANRYGTSQVNYGEAFRRLHLVPGTPSYNPELRESLFISSKTKFRFGKNPSEPGPTAVDDLKRTLTQMFGDGKGHIPEGAYLNAIQFHNMTEMEEVNQLYAGMAERGGKMPDHIGSFTTMLDFRDGTNYTGLNPEHRHWIRHIGITGHLSSPLLMAALRRDRSNNFDTLLVALNANDRLYTSHQNNVLLLAAARGMGVIAMKLFADGVFYGKQPHFSTTTSDVIYSVGKPGGAHPGDFVRYPLSLPGVSCAVTGIGMIDGEKPENDQLVANLTAAVQDRASALERKRIESDVQARHGKATNYFQEPFRGLVQPTDVRVRRDADRLVVEWNTAIAGAEPIRAYEVCAANRVLLSLPYRPQLTTDPLSAWLPASTVGGDNITVVASEAPPRTRS